MDDSTNTSDAKSLTASTSNELQVLTEILSAFNKLVPENRQRMLETVATFLGLTLGSVRTAQGQITTRAVEPTFSEDRSISPKQFLFEKQPKTDVERVACLAYYLTHYRGLEHFKTLDISKLNTEAAQVKFSNPADAVENATKRNYLVSASKGTKQLSALGEQFVLALPDRDRAREIMSSARPRRKPRRGGPDSEEKDVQQ